MLRDKKLSSMFVLLLSLHIFHMDAFLLPSISGGRCCCSRGGGCCGCSCSGGGGCGGNTVIVNCGCGGSGDSGGGGCGSGNDGRGCSGGCSGGCGCSEGSNSRCCACGDGNGCGCEGSGCSRCAGCCGGGSCGCNGGSCGVRCSCGGGGDNGGGCCSGSGGCSCGGGSGGNHSGGCCCGGSGASTCNGGGSSCGGCCGSGSGYCSSSSDCSSSNCRCGVDGSSVPGSGSKCCCGGSGFGNGGCSNYGSSGCNNIGGTEGIAPVPVGDPSQGDGSEAKYVIVKPAEDGQQAVAAIADGAQSQPQPVAAIQPEAPTTAAAASNEYGSEQAQPGQPAIQPDPEQSSKQQETAPSSIGNEIGADQAAVASTPNSIDQQKAGEGVLLIRDKKRQRQRLHASKKVQPAGGGKGDAGVCNSAELRHLMDAQIVKGDANESKRRIYAKVNGHFLDALSKHRVLDVICAPGPFSYRISTDFFCEHFAADVTCFVYQQQQS